MSFLAKISQTAQGIKEKKSVHFIERLLEDHQVHDKIEKEDKGANIDGFIDILDKDGRIRGKITVQVKTVNKEDEGKYRFPCPASLFAHAERTTDVVVLLAVDHSEQLVLWKHISRQLLEDNRDKENQETITLHFSKTERLSQNNVIETIEQWYKLSLYDVGLLTNARTISIENEELREQIVNSSSSKFDLPIEDITKIQLFSDTYNSLFDREFLYFKRLFNDECWKTGLAVFKYDNCELIHSMFPIRYGENSLLIKQLPLSMLKDCKDPFINMNCEKNSIKENPVVFASDYIKKQLSDFIKKNPIIPSYDAFLIEYLREICRQHPEFIIKKEQFDDIVTIINRLEKQYPELSNRSRDTTYSYKNINIGHFYDVTLLLKHRGYTKIPLVYPEHGKYGLTGFVSDFFMPESALKKLEIVVDIAYSAIIRFIRDCIPLTQMYRNGIMIANLIIYDLDYTPQNTRYGFPRLNAYYFEGQDDKSKFCIECYSHNNLHITDENNVKSVYELGKVEPVIHNGNRYKLLKTEGCDINKYIFGHANIITVFNDLLLNYLDDYFEKIVFH